MKLKYIEKGYTNPEDVPDEIIRNGFYVKLSEDNPFAIYCNEKDYKGGFLFKCCEGCIHNPIKP